MAEVLCKWARFEDADRVIADAEVSNDEERMVRHVFRGDYLFWGMDLDAAAVAERVNRDEAPFPPLLQAVGDAIRECRRIVSGHVVAHAELEQIADQVDAPSGRVRAHLLYGSSVAAAMSGRPDEARALAVTGRKERLGDPSSVLDRHPGEFWLLHGFADFVGGEFERSRAIYQRGYDHSVAAGAAAAVAWYAAGLVRMGSLDGQLNETVRFGARMARIGSELAIPAARQIGRSGQAIGLAMLGRVEEAEEAHADAPPSSKPVYRFELTRSRAWIHAARGETSQAIETLHEAAALAENAGMLHNAVIARLDLIRLGRGAEQAAALAELALVSQGVFVPAASAAATAIADDDPGALLQAVERFESMGALLVAAELSALAAEQHRASNQTRQATAAEQRYLGLRARVDAARMPAFGRMSAD